MYMQFSLEALFQTFCFYKSSLCKRLCAINNYEASSTNVINICIKYGFDILIISGSYGGHRRHATDEGQCQG